VWRIRGTVRGDEVRWEFTKVLFEKDPRAVVGAATVEGVLHDGDRFDGHFRNTGETAELSLRRKK
jgi:hypothetical protein